MHQNRKDLFKRRILSNVLPLSTPYKVNIDVANACNFKCKYCFHSLDDRSLKMSGFKPGLMNFELFGIIVQQLKEFPEKIICIGLTGVGEPLLNERLPDMVRLIKEAHISDKVVITTNGSLLTNEMIHNLVDAGLDEIVISIQALTNVKYYEISNVNIDIHKLIKSIEYFYNERDACKVFVKIVDIAFNSIDDEQKFHQMFDDISDMAYVEEIIPQFNSVNYGFLDNSNQRTTYGEPLLSIEICSMIFYTMQISSNGNVCPCCVDYNETLTFGNASKSTLYNIWNSNHYNEFRMVHLMKERRKIKLCANCEYFLYNVRTEDIIDEAANVILARMNSE